jgi:hypothetical protein
VENRRRFPRATPCASLQAAIQKVLLNPDDGLGSVLVMAVAHGSDRGKGSDHARPSEMQERLFGMLRTTSLSGFRTDGQG